MTKPVAWIKIYSPRGDYVAACVHAEDAACLCALYGDGAQARNGHAKKHVIWDEGSESQSAGESYDYAAQLMNYRVTGKR
jgi:hypothetical protein